MPPRTLLRGAGKVPAAVLAIGIREDRPDYDYLDGEQDLDLMASLNLDANRFSISWSPCTGTGRAGASRPTPRRGR
jgi:beta-glucosidase/6-phospho-beta-glucosidase/beta-galactosidase